MNLLSVTFDSVSTPTFLGVFGSVIPTWPESCVFLKNCLNNRQKNNNRFQRARQHLFFVGSFASTIRPGPLARESTYALFLARARFCGFTVYNFGARPIGCAYGLPGGHWKKQWPGRLTRPQFYW